MATGLYWLFPHVEIDLECTTHQSDPLPSGCMSMSRVLKPLFSVSIHLGGSNMSIRCVYREYALFCESAEELGDERDNRILMLRVC